MEHRSTLFSKSISYCNSYFIPIIIVRSNVNTCSFYGFYQLLKFLQTVSIYARCANCANCVFCVKGIIYARCANCANCVFCVNGCGSCGLWNTRRAIGTTWNFWNARRAIGTTWNFWNARRAIGTAFALLRPFDRIKVCHIDLLDLVVLR